MHLIWRFVMLSAVFISAVSILSLYLFLRDLFGFVAHKSFVSWFLYVARSFLYLASAIK